MMFGFLANIADSLTMIKKLVFDTKELTMGELVAILDKDYEGHEELLSRILRDRDHYGNNRDLPDSLAARVAHDATSMIEGRANATERSGIWTSGFHVARMSYDQAPLTATSPDGRLRGEELSKNISASMGRSREGATAAILSATKINAFEFESDASLDLGVHPSAVKGDDGLVAMYALLETFRKRGGHALHINVFGAETLSSAQKDPEKYSDLQIRVCGWNVLFNNILKKEQDEFIKQAEALE
jgi:formate C-acetyltransferase